MVLTQAEPTMMPSACAWAGVAMPKPMHSGYDKMAGAWEPAIRAVISTTQF